jgi:uncharacterized glyoxalase superfamily protein PhnB
MPFEFALKVSDADEFYNELQAAGVELFGEPRDIPWGRTFMSTPRAGISCTPSAPPTEPISER